MPRTHLVIPDSHATPTHNNDRFSLLGKFILDRKPEVIVNIGDMADMASLCSYDKGKRSFEGRRYKKDVNAVIDAQRKLFKPINDYNTKQRSNSKKQYKPELHLTLGNHENRINRATQDDPVLEGTIGVEDLQYEKFGWKVHPFLEPAIIDGICYSHYHTSGIMGRPISGEYPAVTMIKKQYTSCVAGHSHTIDFGERTDPTGKRLQGLVVGCYLDEDQWEDYAGQANKMWWKGVCMLHRVEDGQYDLEFVSIRRMKEMYS